MDKSHKKLEVWKKGVDLSIRVYKATASFPEEERYGLTSQMRRAAVSIPANIAEGAARNTKKELLNFLHIARGSLSELDTHMEIANRLSYLSVESNGELINLMDTVSKTLAGLINSIKISKGD